MPTYSYRCTCGFEFDKLCKISQMDEEKECPSCGAMTKERFIGGAPAMGDSVTLGIRSPDQGFRDRLREIAKRNPGSTLASNSRYI